MNNDFVLFEAFKDGASSADRNRLGRNPAAVGAALDLETARRLVRAAACGDFISGTPRPGLFSLDVGECEVRILSPALGCQIPERRQYAVIYALAEGDAELRLFGPVGPRPTLTIRCKRGGIAIAGAGVLHEFHWLSEEGIAFSFGGSSLSGAPVAAEAVLDGQRYRRSCEFPVAFSKHEMDAA